jgi:hypothetical protein
MAKESASSSKSITVGLDLEASHLGSLDGVGLDEAGAGGATEAQWLAAGIQQRSRPAVLYQSDELRVQA